MNCKLISHISFLCFSLMLSFSAYSKEPNWETYEQLLQKYVSVKPMEGGTIHWVNYSKMKEDPLFLEAVKLIESYPTAELSNQKEKLSFYINAYNILAMKMVVDKWPLKSIKNAGGFFTAVWHKKVGTIDNQTVSLHYLQNIILRKMNEPRIHFAVNCATISAANLRLEAYTAEKLEQQLNEQTRLFLKDSYKGVQKKNNQYHVSKIFKWFKEDFQSTGNIAAYINQYYPIDKDQTILADIDYNWQLNGE
uniref:DUF547 domain-containing protein n=2 Tax=Candidatus Berkiella cookevillensis TaxID=437022 RepID=A0A0Q9YNU6_9GAMM